MKTKNGYPFLFALIFILATQAFQTRASERELPLEQVVYNGEVITSPDAFGVSPVVMLSIWREKNRTLCTGTLIDLSVVLTAAHCVAPTAQSGAVIAVMVHSAGLGSPVIAMSSTIISHPKYRKEDQIFGLGGHVNYNDIALIGLNQPIKNKGTLKVSRTSPSHISGDVVVMGFGRIDQARQNSHGILRMGRVEKIDLMKDSDAASFQFVLIGKTQACQGDSGGPVLRKNKNSWEIISVNSWGALCLFNSRSESVYQHLTWIDQNLKLLREVSL